MTWTFESLGERTRVTITAESVPPGRARRIRPAFGRWKPEFKAEGPSRCTLALEPMGGAVKLTSTHEIERPESKFTPALSEGWPLVLSNLKSLLETGEVAMTNY